MIQQIDISEFGMEYLEFDNVISIPRKNKIWYVKTTRLQLPATLHILNYLWYIFLCFY